MNNRYGRGLILAIRTPKLLKLLAQFMLGKRDVYSCSLLPSVTTTDLIHYHSDQGKCSNYSCDKHAICKLNLV